MAAIVIEVHFHVYTIDFNASLSYLLTAFYSPFFFNDREGMCGLDDVGGARGASVG